MSDNPYGGSPEMPSGHDESEIGSRVSILDLYKDEDPDFKKRCIEVMADGSGFCQFMLWTQRGRHGWWRRIQSVQVPPGCWLRLYVDAPSTQELFFAEERAKTENVQPPTRAMISRTRKTPLLRSGAGEPRQMNDNVGLILDKGSKKPMDLHGSRAFVDVLSGTPFLGSMFCESCKYPGYALKLKVVGMKLTGYDPQTVGRVLAMDKDSATGSYVTRGATSFLPVGIWHPRGLSGGDRDHGRFYGGIEGSAPGSKLTTCGSDLQASIAAMRVFPSTSVTLYSGDNMAKNTARLLSGTYAFDVNAEGTAKKFSFTDSAGHAGPNSIRIFAHQSSASHSGRQGVTSQGLADADFMVSGKWVMMSQLSKDNTGPEWPVLNYGFESTEEEASETGSEQGTEKGTGSSFAKSVETAASKTFTDEHSAGGEVTLSVEAEAGAFFASVKSTAEASANYQYTTTTGKEESEAKTEGEETSESETKNELTTSALSHSAGIAKNKGMECALQCQVPSTLHPATGKRGEKDGTGRAPGNEVNDGVGFTCPEATKIDDPNVYIWFWQVNLLRPDDPTAKTTVDMCVTQCTCTPTPPACPVEKCADEFCTTCKPPMGCPVMRATDDGKFIELNKFCLRTLNVMGGGGKGVKGEGEGGGGGGPDGSYAISQYRKDGDVWNKVWTGPLDLDTTGGWGHAKAPWASGFKLPPRGSKGKAGKITMPGKPVGGDTVARPHNGNYVSGADGGFAVGDHLVFLKIDHKK
jgi:hypothetical protein